MTRSELVVFLADKFSFVREVKGEQNTGLRVQAIQQWCDGEKGDSWCCEFATMILDIAFQGNAPIPRLKACQGVMDLAKQRGWLTNVPSVGDLFLYVNAEGHAHHIGIVTKTSPLEGIAGNTSRDGTSSNGDGVYTHGISAQWFVHYPRGE